jgi:hypothetical protein
MAKSIPHMVHDTVTAQVQVQPTCQPVVYVVSSQPWAWIILSGLLFVLWILASRKRKGPPGIQFHTEPAPLPPPPQVTEPLPEIPQAKPVEPPAPVPVADYTEKRKELESALKNYGWKPAEVKARVANLDMSLPVEDLIMQILKGVGK